MNYDKLDKGMSLHDFRLLKSYLRSKDKMKRILERKFRCTYLYRKFKRCINPLDFNVDEEGVLLCTQHTREIHINCKLKITGGET